MPTVDEKSGKECLNTIAQGDASREEEHQRTLPPCEFLVSHKALARHIECQQKQEHGNGEMVGNDDRQHDISHREIEHRHQRGIEASQQQDLPVDTIGEQIGIE